MYGRCLDKVEAAIPLVDCGIEVLVKERLIQEIHGGVILIRRRLIKVRCHISICGLKMRCVLVEVECQETLHHWVE